MTVLLFLLAAACVTEGAFADAAMFVAVALCWRSVATQSYERRADRQAARIVDLERRVERERRRRW